MLYFRNASFKKSLLATLSLSFASGILAHGWVEIPKARQVFCADDGGYWSDSIPNAACQKAYNQSGDYPFTQKNEFSALVPDYQNQSAVEAVINNKTLCAAGDPRKAGMDIPDKNWQKTSLKPGKNTLKIKVTAAHPNHFFQIYLSKTGYDSASQPLTWDDLELIAEHDEKPVVNGFYVMDYTIPEGREGNAVLYMRWQRLDPAGEGFYNCSDILITKHGNGPDPEPEPLPDMIELGRYITSVTNDAKPGDKARFTLKDHQGEDVIKETISITAKNTVFTAWTAELARKINDLHGKSAQIGFWHAEMNHYMYDEVNIFNNSVFAQEASYTFSTSLISGDAPVPTTHYDYIYPEGIGNYVDGTKVLASDNNIYQCKPWPFTPWSNQSQVHYAPATGIAWSEAWNKL